MTAPRGASPLWHEEVRDRRYQPLEQKLSVDVAIVGAGITGLTAALLLQREGMRVAVIEAERVAAGTSGGTSAHVTEVLDISYRQLITQLGRDGAAAYAAACRDGLQRISGFVDDLRIACEFAWVKGYRITESPEEVAELQEETEAAITLGLRASMTSHVPLPFRVEGGIVFDNQAQFHPVRYLDGLAASFSKEGGLLFEETRVVGIHEEAAVILATDRGLLTAGAVILATHTPINFNWVQTEIAPYRSYVIAVRVRGEGLSGLFWDTANPYHYLRRHSAESEDLLLIGGEDHKTGQEEDTEGCYRRLEEYARARLEVAEVPHRWSAQLYEPADGLPYVGRSPFAENVYIATGYSGVGLVQGTLAAVLLCDTLSGRDNEVKPILDATRFRPVAAARRFASENLDAASRWVVDRLAGPEAASFSEIVPGEGKIVKVAGEKLAAYRDEEGRLHALSAVCRHLGCIVHWNAAERTWDCPCHGGRYAPTGEVLSGPPTVHLRRREIFTESETIEVSSAKDEEP